MTPRMVELPKGSGRVAVYDDAEQALMRDLMKHREATGDSVMNEVLVLHALKVVFGVNIVADQEIL